MPQSKKLTEFYNAYKLWLDNGAPSHEPFSRDYGLCTNYQDWLEKQGYDEEIYDLKCELYDQFEKAGLDMTYPFGSVNYEQYYHDSTQHLDPKRIEWVNSHAKP